MAMSSGEAEHAMKVQVDAYAASGIIGRQGLGLELLLAASNHAI